MITITTNFTLARTISPVAEDDDWVTDQEIDAETMDTTGLTSLRVKALATTGGGQGAPGSCTIELVKKVDGVISQVGTFTASYGSTRELALDGATETAVRLVGPTGVPDKVQIMVKGVE